MKNSIILPNHPAYQKIINVATTIIDSNQDLEFFQKQHWTVVVVDSKDINAFVLPVSIIIIFTYYLSVPVSL